jgi:tetratricopeptide (TPR) repeat protein
MALQLDDSIAEAHASLAFVEMHYEWNWPASEQEFRRALELNPNYATAHEWFAYWLMAQGRKDESIEEINWAQRADPLSIIIKTDDAELLELAGRFDEAIQELREAQDWDPGFRLARYFLGEAYLGQQMYSEALAEYQKALALDPGDVWGLSGLGRTYGRLGQRANAEKVIQRLVRDSRERGDLAIQIAFIYSDLGDKDRAFAGLEQAYQARDGALILLNVLPYLKPLRQDPRFADLIRRVGLSPSSGS